MININHKGPQVSLSLDTTGFTRDILVNSKLAYVQNLKAGRVVELDSSGKLQLSDTGNTANRPLGLLLNDAQGEDYGNRPALAESSHLMAVAFGPFQAVTDQIDTALTFANGDPIYASRGAKVGQITNLQASGATATFGALLGLTVTPVAGAVGNFTLILEGGATAGAETVTTGIDAGVYTLTIGIEDTVSLQSEIETAIETHPWVASVAAASGASAVTLDGDPANNEVTGSGGLDAARLLGIALSSADVNAPQLTVAFF